MEPASPKNNHHYNQILQAYANENRKKMTKAAVYLWNDALRASKLLGYKFRRERAILNYIADFACFQLMLVIEVDGYTHESDEQQRRDRRKDKALKAIGFHVLRITNGEIYHHFDWVMGLLEKTVLEREEELGIVREGKGGNLPPVSLWKI